MEEKWMNYEEKMPLISIITLSYNNIDKIYMTIDSVIAQDYGYIEYIIADDCSKYFPRNEIEDYLTIRAPNLKFKIYQQNENVGTVKNINKAYKLASGEYFINLSCGDIFTSKHTVRDIVNRFFYTSANVLVCSRIKYDSNYKLVCMLPHYKEREIIKQYNNSHCLYKKFILGEFRDAASGSAMYFSRKIIEEYNYFDESYRLWEDGPFIAKYLRNNDFEIAYDIISIFYADGGVSSSWKKIRSSSLYDDTIKFWKREFMICINDLDVRERKLLEYRLKRYEVSNLGDLLKLYISSIPQVLHYLRNSHQRKLFEKQDKKILSDSNNANLGIDMSVLKN